MNDGIFHPIIIGSFCSDGATKAEYTKWIASVVKACPSPSGKGWDGALNID